MVNKHSIQLVCITLILGNATPVFACNICTMAFFDYILPPLVLWQFFPIIWFLGICFVRKRDDRFTWGIPKAWIGILISIGTIIFGNAIGFGPFLTLLLLIPCIILSIITLNKGIRERWTQEQSKKYVTVSIIGSVSLFCLFGLSMLIHINRTPGEYVVEWGINGPGRSIIEKLKNNPASDLDEIRLVVSKSDKYASAELAETLAKRGDPSIDFPILLGALKKAREASLKYREDAFESALKIITGLDQQPGTDIEKWQTAFNNKIKTNSANKANAADTKDRAAD